MKTILIVLFLLLAKSPRLVYNTCMGLSLCVLGSGSTGNCVFVSGGKTNILIDQGLSARRVETALRTIGANMDNMSILLTHTHSDHIGGVTAWLSRHGGTLYCHEGIESAVRARVSEQTKVECFSLRDFYIGELTVSPFAVNHDAPCVGYGVFHNGKKISVATDLGEIKEETVNALSDSDLVLIESNHDEDMLRQNRRYPAHTKRRILSEYGHLSNRVCAECVTSFAKAGVQRVILAHLSRENNYPELAFDTALKRLRADGLYERRDIRIDVAMPDRATELYEV